MALSNTYSSSTTPLGDDVAALVLGKPVAGFHPLSGKVAIAEAPVGFRFGADFYQPNAELRLMADKDGWTLRWPDGALTALIPVGPDRFVDRAYWQDVVLQRDGQGRLSGMTYDRFTGAPVAKPAP